jgi:hypothetical protein
MGRGPLTLDETKSRAGIIGGVGTEDVPLTGVG